MSEFDKAENYNMQEKQNNIDHRTRNTRNNQIQNQNFNSPENYTNTETDHNRNISL